jgi:type I site-specific restriction-modification system R (restriction) subunit
MTPNPYSEDHLVEQPALALLAQLGWQIASGLEETIAPEGGSLGRRDRREVVLQPRLRAALERFNPGQPPEAINVAIEELSRNRSAMGLVAANREVYRPLKDGVLVSVPDPERGGLSKVRLRVVDWDRPAENDWLAVNQFTIQGDLYNCIPDLVGFVNGLPLVVIEFKKPGVSARVAFDDNLTHYKAAISQLFWSNAFLIASNGTASRIGSLSADWERFFEWKRIASEDEPRRVSLEVMLRGTCQPQRLLDYVENFTLFSDSKSGLVKIIAQNHQVIGVNNAIAATLEARRRGHGRAGVFWQTQGSGKSFSMGFYSQKIQRKVPGDWTFVIVTDRTDLDEQFVCAMWLTGFDAPSCSTLYLDKPMRNHTLMQTIARANRVFPGKHSGLIVDYANVFASLERALALYGGRSGSASGAKPTRDKSVLVDQLRQVLTDALGFCAEHQVDIAAIQDHTPGMQRLQAIGDAVEALIAPEPLRQSFLEQQRLVQLLHAAIKPDPVAREFAASVGALNSIAASIREKLHPNPPDIRDVMGDIARVLDRSITGIAIREQGPPSIDLSQIDFQALADKFRQKRNKKTELEELKALIAAQLARMVQLNPTRANYRERFEELIASYNAGSRGVEEIYKQLLQLSLQLSQEQQRHIRENLSEEELAMFDILLQSAPDLSDSDRAKVKQSARELVEKIKRLLVLNWQQKSEARAKLKLLIEDALDIGLPRAYTPELYQRKCAAVFAHIEQAYPERDRSVYAMHG